MTAGTNGVSYQGNYYSEEAAGDDHGVLGDRHLEGATEARKAEMILRGEDSHVYQARRGPTSAPSSWREVGPVCGLVAVLVLSLIGLTTAPTPPAAASDVGISPIESKMASEIIGQINAERMARGVPVLSYDATLAGLAQGYADQQASGAEPPGDPDYTYSQHSAYQWFGYGSAAAGATTVSSTYTLAWMGSTPHRDTLLQNVPGQGIGVGVSCAANGTTWVQFAVGSVTSPDPLYTSDTPAAPVVASEGTGSACSIPLVSTPIGTTGWPTVGLASSPVRAGYWITDTHGNVSTAGNVSTFGGTGRLRLNAPINHIVATPDGGGYWLVASDGGVFAFGDAHFYGSMGAAHLNASVVDMAPTPDGGGYWLVAGDGGIFSFGDAHFYGSMGGTRLNRPVVGVAASPSGKGYWLIASDGGIFAFGDAAFHGSTGGMRLNAPIVGMTPTHSGNGYRFVASDGGVFTFGDASFNGSATGKTSVPVVAIATDTASGGYWVADAAGVVFGYNALAF